MQAALKIDPRESFREAMCDFCCTIGLVGLESDGATMCAACLGDDTNDADTLAQQDATADSASARDEYERTARVRP